MKRPLETGVFKPKPTHSEAKGDATTRVAREILNKETAARIEKTERLRKARLAKDVADAPTQLPVKTRKRSR